MHLNTELSSHLMLHGGWHGSMQQCPQTSKWKPPTTWWLPVTLFPGAPNAVTTRVRRQGNLSRASVNT